MPISTDKAKRAVRRPKTYLDEYAEEEEHTSKNADGKNAMVVQKLAPLGVPVTKHGLQHRSDWEKARAQFMQTPSTFPATMPFESWCCITSFDVSKDDGGPQFQRLMAYLLTESTGASVSTLEADIKKEKRRPPDSYYTLTGWPKGRRVNGSYDKVYVSDTAGFTKQTYRAANVGNRSNNTVNKRSWLIHGKEPKVKLSTSVPLETYSKAAWLIASSVTPAQQSGVHSVAWSFTTDGTSLSKAANMGEENGKLAAGNLTAQIFGLYWYPDCNSEANNWSVNGIRMRMFNPSYVLTKNEWLLKQPLHNGGGVMGGEGGLRLPTPTAMNKVLENMLFVPATDDVDLSHFRLENWLCPMDGSPKYATMTNGGVLETTESHPITGGVPLNHYVLGPHLSGGPFRPFTLNYLFGDVVFLSELNRHVDLDIGFRSPEHRDVAAGVAGVHDTSQPQKRWQLAPEWRDMPGFESQDDARRWVRTRLDKWTRIAQEEKLVRTRYLFYWGPERLLPPLETNEQTGAPSSSSATNEEVDLDSQSEEVDLDVEPEEGNRNAFTEEVEIGQEVEYIDGVDEADGQRINEQYQTVEIPIASTADLREYNNDDGARSTANPGDEYAYPGSTPHFHPSAVPYPRSAFYTEAQYTEGGPQTLGLPRKTELDALLDDRPEDFARVIGIWALQQGIKHISTKNSAEIIQLTQKQLGMTNGVYRDSKGAVVYAKPRVGTVFTVLYKPAINFGSQAKLAKIREEVLELFKWDLLSGHQSRDNSDDVRELVQFIRKHKITSSMTVGEWYNTPWHIAHLPLTAEQLHLQFHETFSMACRRCVRAFYEYDIMHATYFRTPTTFRGLPSRFFKLKAAGKYDAPVPFHEKQLWKPNANPRDTHVSNVRPVLEEGVGNPEHGLGGHHNWEIEIFDKDKVEKPPPANNPEELRYKAHRNHLFEYASNAAIVQGRANTRSKVPLYATNFKLRRVSAYSNLCMDCAADMERLNLLARPWKKQPTAQGSGVAAAMNARVRAPVRVTSEERRARTEREYHAFVRSTPMPMQHKGRTMFSQPPDVYISKDLRFVNSSAKQDDAAKIKEALQVLEEVLHPTSAAAKAAALKRLGASLSDGPTRMNGMIDILTDAFSKYTRVSDGDFQGVTPQYDSDVYRLEYRTKDTLRIVNFKPKVEVQSATRSVPVMEKVDPVVYRKGASQWAGDKYWEAECDRQKWDCSTRFQRRRLTQTRLFITWALHRPVTNEGEARAVLEKMRGAVEELFTDRHLSEMLRFGEKLVGTKPGERVAADSISRAQWATISAPRKADAQVYFYGGKGKEESSYLSDTYETHVEEVSVDAGCEIGPKRKHPHMHILLTVKHWSYMQLDTWHMSALFEAMFRGVGEWSDGRFKLWDASGLPFYTDQENPYINIKLYPQDNWQDIIANYVRKSSDLMSIVARTGGS